MGKGAPKLMALREILLFPNRSLRQRARQNTRIDAATQRLLDDMFETMYAAQGIGLAAPQIGILLRIVVIDLKDAEDPQSLANPNPQPLALINPEVTWHSSEESRDEEGCLSLPGLCVPVQRPRRVELSYQDRDGVQRCLCADELLATCVQHEIDHLHGRLIIDHLPAAQRQKALKDYATLRQRGLE